MSQSISETRQRDRIAVIAVHGVGDQTSGASAREIAGLLQVANHDAQGRPIYGPFAESKLDLQVKERETRNGRHDEESLDFTRRALARVRIEEKDRRYGTIVLSGQRRDDQGRTTGIDIFELYWADLSRLGDGLLHVLGNLYQLLFHLASLGLKTVRLAAVTAPSAPLKSLCRAQAAAEGMIGAVIPILNLFMLLVMLPVFVLVMAPVWTHAAIVGLLAGVLAGYGVFLALRARFTAALVPPADTHRLAGWRPIVPVVVFGIVSLCAALWLHGWGPTRGAFLALSVLLLGAGFLIARQLHRRRETEPRYQSAVTYTAGLATLLWLGLVGLRCLDRGMPDGMPDMVRLGLFIAEGFLRALELASFVLVGIGWWMLIAGWLAGRRTQRYGAVHRAIWTGRMGVFLPASLFLTLTLVIWSALLALLGTRLKGPEYGYVPWSFAELEGGLAGDVAPALLNAAAGAGFNAFVLCLFTAFLIAGVGMAPSIAAEVRATTGDKETEARKLGAWLDRGLRALRFAGYLILFGWLIVMPVFELVASLAPELLKSGSLSWVTDPALLHWLGGAIVASVGVVLTLRNILFKAVGTVVDIGLDVDNWLKEKPFRSNPRGRILSRHLALLDHVCRNGYTRLVIVSHSQGTVVSADLLRYLTHDPAPRPQGLCGDIPVRLATFGSPLYQLYSLRFPHLYGWVRKAVAGKSGAQSPDLTEFGVEAWLNGYRTGDYVGRFVATREVARLWFPDKGVPAPDWQRGGILEYCVGAGAHTHYFDETAPHVGVVLDGFINLDLPGNQAAANQGAPR